MSESEETWVDRLWCKWWGFSKHHYLARRFNGWMNQKTNGWWGYQGHKRRNLPCYLREARR